jgi:hypothetical protein
MRTMVLAAALAATLAVPYAVRAAPVQLTQLASFSCTYEQCGTSVGARTKGAGRYLYAATPGVGLKVFDIRTPSAPVLLTTVSSMTQGGDVIAGGRYLYLVSGGGIQVADARDPAAPVLAGQVGFSAGGGNFSAMSGKYVYAGLKVVDVSDPAAPAVVGSLPISGAGTPWGLAISGTNAYVVDDGGRVHIIDVSDPTAAIEIAYLDLGEPAYDIAIAGTYAYVVTHAWFCDDEGCTRIPGHLQILDISCPPGVSVVSSIVRPKAPEGILVSGGYAYLSEQSTNFFSYAGEVTVVDVRSPATPVDVAWAGTPSFANSYVLGYGPQGITVAGSAVYVTTPWNLYVYSAFTANGPAQCH